MLFMCCDEVEVVWGWVDLIFVGWCEYYQSLWFYLVGSNGLEQV